MAAYASADDLVARYDERTVKELASDTNEPVLDLSSSTRVTAALEAASGRVEAALLVGGLYSTTDLAALSGNSLALLKSIVCQLAMVTLIEARPGRYAAEVYESLKKDAHEFLDSLRKGASVFDVAATLAAGTPSVDGPTAVEYDDLNLLPDRVRRFYPGRGQRLPIGRG